MTPQVRPVLAALGLAGVVLVGGASSASAHNQLESTSPQDGATLATPPAAVVLTFDEPSLALGSQVVVTGPEGKVVSSGEPELVDDDVTERLTGALPAGRYRVQWRITSDDGHPVSGQFAFTATAAGGSAGGGGTPTPTAPAGTGAPAPASSAGASHSMGSMGSMGSTRSSSSGSSLLGWSAGTAAVVVVGAAATVIARRRRGAPGPDGPR